MNVTFNILIYCLIIPFIYMCLFKETYLRKRIGFGIAFLHRKLRVHYLYILIGIILNIIFFFYKPLVNNLLPYDRITIPFLAILGIIMIIFTRNRIFGKWLYGLYSLIVLVMYSMFGVSTEIAVTIFIINILCGLYIVKIGRNKIHMTVFLTFASVFLLINYIGVRTTIPTGSMEKTIPAGSSVIGNRIKYKFFNDKWTSIYY